MASPKTRAPRKPIPFKLAKTRCLPNGTIEALSSDGVTVYAVTLDPDTCTCKAGANGRACYHVRTARLRFAPVPVDAPAAVYPIAWFRRASTSDDPEPPTPAAPAARLTCSCILYGPDPSCGCQQPVQEAA